jgi:hypothetical protein
VSKASVGRRAREVALDVGQVDVPIRDQVIEPLHEHAFGDDGQGLERCILEASVKVSIEGRASHGISAQLGKRTSLVSQELVACPAIMGGKDGSGANERGKGRDVHDSRYPVTLIVAIMPPA